MTPYAITATLEFLEPWLDYRLRNIGIPGLSLAIYYQDRLLFSRAYGVASIDTGQPLTTDHLFTVASQSKMFTATAILQLVQAGRIQLDHPAVRYLPWLAEHSDHRYAEITIRQLLTHSAGLVRDGVSYDQWGRQITLSGQAGLAQAVLAHPLVLEPNTQVKYSNLGFALLGQIIEAVAGKAYVDYVENSIIRSLNLSSTYASHGTAPTDRLVATYGPPQDKKRQALPPFSAAPAFAPAFGIISNPEDMCRFAATYFIDNQALLGRALKKETQRSQWVVASGYDAGYEFGLGLEVMAIGPRRVVGHSGHIMGCLSATYLDPDQGLAVSVAASSKDAPAPQIAQAVFEALNYFTDNASTPTPTSRARFNTRLHCPLASVQVVATADQIIAIDPDTWQPFTDPEELTQTSPTTLQITTPGSIFNHGELVRYTFAAKSQIRSVEYAGFAMVPDQTKKPAANRGAKAKSSGLKK